MNSDEVIYKAVLDALLRLYNDARQHYNDIGAEREIFDKILEDFDIINDYIAYLKMSLSKHELEEAKQAVKKVM